ncbi:MAG: Antitoxin of toxin-antitoxin system StbD [Rickettsiaceae bacterium]|jgi:prevent-host-death family protein|nr:Antitoxin of toxin-antitoxin system StbD [Rickettsiaceae bacterium]
MKDNYRISATELNKHSGQILHMVQRKPVIIEKIGHPAAVIISYEYFTELEDYYFGSQTKKIDDEGDYLSAEDSERFLRDVRNLY